MNKKVLITGASGLIGSNLVDLLLKHNYHVIGIAKSFPLKKINLKQFSNTNYNAVEGDICNQVFVEEIIEQHNPDIVVHLAAQAIVGDANRSSLSTFEVNVRGTWILLEAVKKLKTLDRIIIASSDKAYGSHDILPYKEDYELKAVHPYDVSKKMTEDLAMSYFRTFELPVAITRCANVFGLYDTNWSRIVPGTIHSCLNNKKIILRSDGTQERCYIYAEDATSAYLALIESPVGKVAGQAFNIGTDNTLSVLAITKLICEKMGVDPSEIHIENSAQHEILSQSLDSSKIADEIGWKAQFDIGTALETTIAWYRNFNSLLT